MVKVRIALGKSFVEGEIKSPKTYLDKIFVSPEQRGVGIGSRLIGDFTRQARRAGSATIQGVFAPDSDINPGKVKSFYRRHGFKIETRDDLPVIVKRL